MLNVKWCISEDNNYINFDRYDEGDREEYFPLRVSSSGALGKDHYFGEKDGMFFVMAYDEDCGWDYAEILIFDMNNKVDYEEH